MRITILSALDVGGAGKAAVRLHEGLHGLGLEPSMLTMERRGGLPGVRGVWPDEWAAEKGEQPWLKAWKHWQGLWSSYPERPQGLEVFTDTYGAVDIAGHPLVRGADVLNLHWMPGLLDMTRAPEILGGKPVVWTLHDMNPFTGGCHYCAGCRRFETGCGCCPQLGSTDPDDLSRQIWLAKQKAYAALRPVLVSPSVWLADEARSSLLGRHLDIRVIPYGLPLTTFAPRPREEFRRKHSVPQDAQLVLLGHEVLSDRKGWRYLAELMERFPGRVGGRPVIFGIFGSLPHDIKPELQDRIRLLGRQDDEAELAGVYSMADVYVMASLEDNLPNTALEALACGTPTVAFACGGLTDIVQQGMTGHLATPMDTDGLVRAIGEALEQGPGLRAGCRAVAEQKYALGLQAGRYAALYAELLDRRAGRGRALSGQPRGNDGRKPLLSIITPVYNAEADIVACLEGVIAQGAPDVEHVVVDGGSGDGTMRIVRDYAARHPHIRWLSEKDGGQSEAMNRGIALCSAEVVGFLNVDDTYEPGVLKKICGIFRKLKTPSFVVGNCNVHLPDGTTYLNRPARLELFDLVMERGEHPFNPSAYFYHKSLHELAGRYDEDEEFVMDLDFLLRCLPLAHRVHVDELWGNMKYAQGTKTYEDNARGLARRRVVASLARHASRMRISFVVPAYNCEDTLAESIASIYDGNFTAGDEVIIVDDASEDGTYALACGLALRHPALRVLRHGMNKGSAAAGRNTAIDASQNELIFCLDADNVLEPHSVPRLKSHLLAQKADAAAFGELRFFTRQVGEASHSWFFEADIGFEDALLRPTKAPCSSGNYLFSRAAWKRAGRYDESSGGAYDSYVFGLAQLACGARMVTLPGSWYWHRHGHESAFVRECSRRNTSLLVLRSVLPHLDALDPGLVERILSPEWRTTWFDRLEEFRREPGCPAPPE